MARVRVGRRCGGEDGREDGERRKCCRLRVNSQGRCAGDFVVEMQARERGH